MVVRDGVAGQLRLVGAAVVAGLCIWAVMLAIDAPGALAADGECPNGPRRIEQGSGTLALPECRAYEMVTPAVKGSGEPWPGNPAEIKGGDGMSSSEIELRPLQPDWLFPTQGARSSIAGDRFAWLSDPLPQARAPGVNHLAMRTASGWKSVDLVPPMSVLNGLVCPLTLGVSAWSSDLAHSLLDLPAAAPGGFTNEWSECGHDEPRLVPGEPEAFRNLFVKDNLTGSAQLVNLTPGDVVWPERERRSEQRYWPASFLAGSDDLSHVVFEEELPLTEAAEKTSPEVEEACANDEPACWQGQDNLYEWSRGEVRLATILPGGTPIRGALAGSTRNRTPASGEITKEAINIARFRHAVSADGPRVFFEAPGDEGEGDLYLREDGARTVQIDVAEAGAAGPSGGGDFQAASADGSRVFFTDDSRLTADSTDAPGEPDLYRYDVESGRLTDLTANAAEPANVLGVSGAAEDGSYVYFVATGVLSGDANSLGDTAVAGEPNLYVVHDGVTRFVATLNDADDQCDWTWNAHCAGGKNESGLTARASSSGGYLGFNSVGSLTGYNNTDANTGEPDIEIFLYDALADQLSCASCAPDGAPPDAGSAIHWPAPQSRNEPVWHNFYPQRNVSDNGQVFFETADALLPRDGNGRRDVYEYAGGTMHLISSGASDTGSHFLDATPDGSSVFFSTAERLLPSDVDNAYDYYAARVGGGFRHPPPPLAPCEGEGCRVVGTGASAAAPPGTTAFTGSGNVRSAGGCSSASRRAAKLSRRAKRLRRHALRAGSGQQAKRMRRKAFRLARRARNQGNRAKRCRRRPGDGRAGASRARRHRHHQRRASR